MITANKSHTLMTGLSLRPLVPEAQQLPDVAGPGTAVSVPTKRPGHGVDRDVPLKGNCRGKSAPFHLHPETGRGDRAGNDPRRQLPIYPEPPHL